jgi:hypothetical protein
MHTSSVVPSQKRSRATSTAQSSGPQLVTETKLMQQYRIAAAVHGGGDITAIEDGAGAVDVLTVGTDTRVWDFYTDASSETGTSAALTPLFASRVAAGRAAGGQLVLFAADHLQLNYVVENTPGSSSRWGSLQTATLPLPQGAVTISEVYTAEIGGSLYVGALIETDSVGPSKTYAFVYSVWSDNPGTFSPTTMTLSTLNCLWSGHDAATAEFTCLDVVYIGYKVASRSVVRYPFAATFSSLAVATTLDRASNNHFFAVLNDGNLYQMVGGDGSKPYSWAQITQQQSYRDLATTLDASGKAHLFALASNADLVHLAAAPETPNQFSSPAIIARNVALMSVSALTPGDVQLFAIGRAQASMSRLTWQADSGNWQVADVQIPTSGQVEEYISYATDLQILDSAGAPMPNASLQVRASAQTRITVNGSTFTIDPNTPATLNASAAGTLTVIQETRTLVIPTLQFDLVNLTTEPLALQQFAGVQQKLAAVTGDELMNAKKAGGEYLLPAQYRTPSATNSLAQTCNQVMVLSQWAGSPQGGAAAFARQGDRPGCGALGKHHVTDLHRIVLDPERMEMHWQLDFSNGNASFRALTAETARTLVVEKHALHETTHRVGGFLDWIGSIGDFIAGIADGVIDVTDILVTTIGNGVQALITFIVDGVTYIFNTVVDWLDQAFDLVQVVFARVKAFFGDLFEWLGFLFDWDDILRTHRALAYTTNQFLTFLPTAVGGVQRFLDSGIATVQSQITQIFDRLISQVGGDSLGGYVNANTPNEPAYTSSNANNVVLNATLDNAASARYPALGPNASAPFDAVRKLIEDLVNAVEGQPAFQQALDYMTNLGSSPDQIFVQLTSALLRVVQGLAQAMLAGVQVVLDAILELVQQFIAGVQSMLNEEWDIPFVTAFYSWLTDGSKLTLLDLMSLVLAIPATVLYKAMNGAAPFPDDASVSAFEASFDAATILANSGLASGPSPARARTQLDVGESIPLWQVLLSTAGFLSFSGYGILSALMDVKPMTGAHIVDPLVKTLTKIALGLEITAQALGCPWIYGASAPGCSDRAGASGVFWIYESFGVLLDAGFTWYDEAFPENNDTNWGLGIAELYGVGHVIVTGVLGSKLSGLGLASKIVLLIPECCKFLRLPRIETASEGWSLVGIAALDGLCIPVSGLLAFADSVSSTESAESIRPALIPGAA